MDAKLRHGNFGAVVTATRGSLRAWFRADANDIADAFFPTINQFISSIATFVSSAMRSIGAAPLGLTPWAGRPKDVQPA